MRSASGAAVAMGYGPIMRVALVSDLHLAGPEDPRQARFLAWLGALRADRLCLLGDVFHHWWHWDDRPFPQYAPVVDALASASIPLVVLPGNHDFHAPAFFARVLGATTGATVEQTWDGRRVVLAHGDHVDRSAGYRALSALLRGRAFAAAVDAMGPERAWGFLGRLGGHGDVRPSPVLVQAQEEDARRRLSQGADLVVYGHTHAPGLRRWPEGVYLNLGDGVRHATWGRVEDWEAFLEGA